MSKPLSIDLTLQFAGLQITLSAQSDSGGSSSSGTLFSGQVPDLTAQSFQLESCWSSLFDNPDSNPIVRLLQDVTPLTLQCFYQTGVDQYVIAFTFQQDQALLTLCHSPAFGSAVQLRLTTPAVQMPTIVTTLTGLKDLLSPAPIEVVWYQTGNSSSDTIKAFQQMLTMSGGQTQLSTLNAGLNVAGLNNLLSATPSPAPSDQTALTNTSLAVANTTLTAASGNVSWYSIKRQLGPVSLSKLGIGLIGNQVQIDLYAALNSEGLSLGLQNLSLAIPVDQLLAGNLVDSLSLSLQGMSLSYQESNVTLSGECQYLPQQDNWSASAQLTLPAGGLALAGAFSSNPFSGYLYGVASGQFVASESLDIDELAAGFGYNRQVNLPSVANVDQDVFITALAGGSANTESATSIVRHEDFVALGLQAWSYQQLKTDAVVALNLGQDLSVDLVAVTDLKLPRQGDTLASAKLGLIGSVNPQQGTLLIEGQLLAGSYVLTPDCTLHGGFAVAAWFGDNSHAGDFVITLGGYGNSQTVPNYYPVVPRLSFDWHVSHDIDIQGDAYWSITPHQMGAGGKLSAVCHVHDAKAWFDEEAEFSIAWQPLHYDGTFHVDVGAKVDIDCGFFDIKVHVSLGATLEMWGPEFSGKVDVKVCHISIPFSFGSGSRSKPTMSWSNFQQAYLPAPVTLSNGSTSVSSWLSTQIGGEVSTPQTGLSSSTIVNPAQFSLTLDSQIPFSTTPYVTPCQQSMASETKLTITASSDQFVCTASDKPFPSALWQEAAGSSSTITSLLGKLVILPMPNLKPSVTAFLPLSSVLISAQPEPLPSWPTTTQASLSADTSNNADSNRTALLAALGLAPDTLSFSSLPKATGMTLS